MPVKTQAIVLAAGTSSRFNTSATKLSFTICGQEMIRYPLHLLQSLNLKTTVVVGYQQDVIQDIIEKYNYPVTCVEQKIQKGTGHALLCTKPYWSEETLLILNGDAPLITKEHITLLINRHRETEATVSFIASYNADPTIKGYGRVIDNGNTISIVEQRDFTGDPAKECRLNAGVYLIERSFLEETLPVLETHPSGEIFITDLILKASETGKHVEVVDVPFDSVRGINTLKELWVAERLVRSDIISSWMNEGVRFLAPESVIIDHNVTLSPDTVIGYGVQLRNGTKVGKGVTIDAFSVLDGAVIGDKATVHSHSVISHSLVHTAVQIGPYARVHRESTLHPESVVGNFVEISRTSLGTKSKAKHLSYLGQTKVGKEANIGAGAITCNYDGVSKHTTTIEDRAFIGSNTALIAPVTIGKEAIVAAGSTITESVPAEALAIARQRQTTKKHYAPHIRRKKQPAPLKATPEKRKELPPAMLKIKLATQTS